MDRYLITTISPARWTASVRRQGYGASRERGRVFISNYLKRRLKQQHHLGFSLQMKAIVNTIEHDRSILSRHHRRTDRLTDITRLDFGRS